MLLSCLACGPAQQERRLDLPERPADARGGDEVARELRGLEIPEREERIFAEIARGNVPGWLRRLRPVEVRGEVAGEERSVTFWTTPDYLAVGSDTNFVLVPLSARTAQRVADLAGASLPTPRMVDAIWAAADLRVEPIRLRPDEDMTTVRTLERHDRLVKAQRSLHKEPPGVFAAGHKVDVVVTSRLAEHPGEIALYGWHRSSGQLVQPLFIGATDSLVTFSHGVRLVDREVLVDGEPADLWDVLGDPELAPLLSRAGVVARAQYPVEADDPEREH